jgi:hypothetical protein
MVMDRFGMASATKFSTVSGCARANFTCLFHIKIFLARTQAKHIKIKILNKKHEASCIKIIFKRYEEIKESPMFSACFARSIPVKIALMSEKATSVLFAFSRSVTILGTLASQKKKEKKLQARQNEIHPNHASTVFWNFSICGSKFQSILTANKIICKTTKSLLRFLNNIAHYNVLTLISFEVNVRARYMNVTNNKCIFQIAPKKSCVFKGETK